jgi:competence protein ComEA
VTLRDGDRVSAAIEAAGGVTGDADLDRINLAKRLRDEDQVSVPRLHDPVRLALDTSAGPSPAMVDLNRASLAELDALPGIGATYAQRILDSRHRDGPFRTVDELQVRQIMPRATYDRIKDRLTARP